MAKTGLDFYRMDTNRYQDIKIKRLKKEFNTSGIAVYDYILTEIYRVKGGFIEWDECTAFDVADYFGIKEALVNEIVNYCCVVGLFNKELLTSESILTSKSIQLRYIEMCRAAKRVNFSIPKKYNLTEETPKLTEDLPKVQEETPKLTEDFAKVKKSKVNNSKLNENKDIPPDDVCVFDFEKSLLDFGFEKKLVSEWLLVRKKKKGINTETAFNRFVSEVQKTGKPPNEILELVVSRSWIGFEAKWIEENLNKNFKNNEEIKRPNITNHTSFGKF